MTKAEWAKMAKLEAENRELREKLDQQIKVYGEMLSEIVTLKGSIAAVRFAVDDVSNDD